METRYEGGSVMAKTVAELLIERLIDWGVDTIQKRPYIAGIALSPMRSQVDGGCSGRARISCDLGEISTF
jgi:hypothetical protein